MKWAVGEGKGDPFEIGRLGCVMLWRNHADTKFGPTPIVKNLSHYDIARLYVACPFVLEGPLGHIEP
jgi:hypothetical protein